MTPHAIALVAIALLGLTSCASSDSPSSASSTASSASSSGMTTTCPNDLPTACPTPPPSIAKDVMPVLQESCTTCHSPTGRQPGRPLTDYAHVQPQVSAVLNQVHNCKMPPSDGPALTAEGRKTLQTWLICGSPNN